MDPLKIGHIGVEVVAIGGLAYYLINQNKLLQAQIDELKKQLSHVAIHINHSQQELRSDLEAMKKQKNREALRSDPVESSGSGEESPPVRSRRLSGNKDKGRRSRDRHISPAEESPRTTARAAARDAIRNPPVDSRRTIPPPPPTPSPSSSGEDDDDVETALKRRSV